MRVFVTGGSGFIGKRLVPRLLDSGHEATVLLLPGERPPPMPGAEFVRGDITDAPSLDGLCRGHDAVLHLAGAVGYGQTMAHCLRLNRDGTRNVAEAAADCDVRRFVHMSSVSVYGRVANVRLTENAPLRKTGDPYGDTKIDAERIVRGYADGGRFELTVLRPTVIYGPGDDKFLPKLAENLRSGRARVIGRGDNTVDAVHVDDVADFVVRALDDPATFGETYNLNHPANPTWAEFVRLVAAELGVDPPARRIPYPMALAIAAGMEALAVFTGRDPRLTRYAVRVVGRQYHYVTDRAQAAGFAPRVNLAAGVAEYFAGA